MNSKKAKLTAILLALAILVSSLPLVIAHAEEGTIHLGVFSDPHYFPNSLSGGNNEAFFQKNYYKNKEYDEHDSQVSNALEGIEKVLSEYEEEGANFLLIPGDLTKDGELEGHKELAAKLEEWEARTGIPVFVTNGNHDINNSDASTFVNGIEEQGEKTSPEQFREIYKNLGFDEADSFFTPADYPAVKGGMLSYAANLGDAFRLIVVDTNIYTVDNGAKEEEHVTDGTVGPELLKWVVKEAEKAKREGRTPFVMQHHNIVPHMEIEEATFFAFVLKDWLRVCETYADAGIHYVYSGHLHSSDTSSH
ncbi:MAG: metallophosphoesterase, partial [Clostridia bacterium]|nr:metallophosphoesterase [Clostridia bacterium]